MVWAKFDDQYPHHPKLSEAGDLAALGFDVAGVCYCNRHLTNGFISNAALPNVYPAARNPKRLAEKLVAVGRWERTGEGWLVHDFLDFNPSREEVETERKKKQEAGRKGGKKSGESRRQAQAEQNGTKPEAPASPSASSVVEPPLPTRPQPSKNNPSSSSTQLKTVPPNADDDGDSLRSFLQTEGFHTDDIDTVLERFRFRSNITDPLALARKTLHSMGMARSADPGESLVVEFDDGFQVEFVNGSWQEVRGERAS